MKWHYLLPLIGLILMSCSGEKAKYTETKVYQEPPKKVFTSSSASELLSENPSLQNLNEIVLFREENFDWREFWTLNTQTLDLNRLPEESLDYLLGLSQYSCAGAQAQAYKTFLASNLELYRGANNEEKVSTLLSAGLDFLQTCSSRLNAHMSEELFNLQASILQDQQMKRLWHIAVQNLHAIVSMRPHLDWGKKFDELGLYLWTRTAQQLKEEGYSSSLIKLLNLHALVFPNRNTFQEEVFEMALNMDQRETESLINGLDTVQFLELTLAVPNRSHLVTRDMWQIVLRRSLTQMDLILRSRAENRGQVEGQFLSALRLLKLNQRFAARVFDSLSNKREFLLKWEQLFRKVEGLVQEHALHLTSILEDTQRTDLLAQLLLVRLYQKGFSVQLDFDQSATYLGQLNKALNLYIKVWATSGQQQKYEVVNQICNNYLEMGITEQTISLNELNDQMIGCLKVSANQKNLELNKRNHNLTMSLFSVLRLNNHSLNISARDVDLSIVDLSATAEHPLLATPTTNRVQDGVVIPLIMGISPQENIRQFESSKIYFLPYHFVYQRPQRGPEFAVAPAAGFSGGNLTINIFGDNTRAPLFVSNGGPGQKAAGSARGGLGVVSSLSEVDLMLHLNTMLPTNSNFQEKVFLRPGDLSLRDLKALLSHTPVNEAGKRELLIPSGYIETLSESQRDQFVRFRNYYEYDHSLNNCSLECFLRRLAEESYQQLMTKVDELLEHNENTLIPELDLIFELEEGEQGPLPEDGDKGENGEMSVHSL